MKLQEAIVARHSVRQYLEKPIESEKVEQLQALIDECNKEGQLHLQLVTNEPKAFASGMAKYGGFKGVGNYIAVVGPKGEDKKLGYYGEKVVLLAQSLGLNTCWVGLSYKKQPDQYQVLDGESLLAVIAMGYGSNQGTAHPQKKGIEHFCHVDGVMPEWFHRGMEAALLAPTAVNQQKFYFEYAGIVNGRHQVHARKGFSLVGYAKIDLGIAKCHFEIGAGKENFDWI